MLRRDLGPEDTHHAVMCLLPVTPHGNKGGIVKAAWFLRSLYNAFLEYIWTNPMKYMRLYQTKPMLKAWSE